MLHNYDMSLKDCLYHYRGCECHLAGKQKAAL